MGALAPWRGAGITECTCPACERAGEDLMRFDGTYRTVPPEVRVAVREHGALALSEFVRTVLYSSDPAATLRHLRDCALHRARLVTTSHKVALDPPPKWQTNWR